MPKRLAAASVLTAGLAVALTAGAAAAGASPPQPAATAEPGSRQVRIEVGGLERTARVYVPERVGEHPPVVLVLHGGFGTGTSAARQGGWDAAARARTASSPSTPTASVARGTPEVVLRTADAARRRRRRLPRRAPRPRPPRLRTDAERVFVTGISNGGMMAYRLACEASDHVAAIAPVAATLVFDGCAPGASGVVAAHPRPRRRQRPVRRRRADEVVPGEPADLPARARRRAALRQRGRVHEPTRRRRRPRTGASRPSGGPGARRRRRRARDDRGRRALVARRAPAPRACSTRRATRSTRTATIWAFFARTRAGHLTRASDAPSDQFGEAFGVVLGDAQERQPVLPDRRRCVSSLIAASATIGTPSSIGTISAAGPWFGNGESTFTRQPPADRSIVSPDADTNEPRWSKPASPIGIVAARRAARRGIASTSVMCRQTTRLVVGPFADASRARVVEGLRRVQAHLHRARQTAEPRRRARGRRPRSCRPGWPRRDR